MNNCQKCNNNPVSNLKGTENWNWCSPCLAELEAKRNQAQREQKSYRESSLPCYLCKGLKSLSITYDGQTEEWKNEKECCKKEEAPKCSTCQREPIYMQGLKECLNCLRMAPELKAQIIQRPPYNY